MGRAYDEQHPPFLRLPILKMLQDGMDEHSPDLKPAGYDAQGQVVCALADIAQALDIPEDELLDHAEKQGMLERIKADARSAPGTLTAATPGPEAPGTLDAAFMQLFQMQ